MLIVEGHGWRLTIALFSGQNHEAALVEDTLETLKGLPKAKNLLGDKAYGSEPLSQRVFKKHQIYLTAPPKRHYLRFFHDGRRLRRIHRRWKVERAFAWLKSFRRLQVRWEVKAENYVAVLEVACSMMLIKHAL